MTGRLFSANSEWWWVMLGMTLPQEPSQQGPWFPTAVELYWKNLGIIHDILTLGCFKAPLREFCVISNVLQLVST